MDIIHIQAIALWITSLGLLLYTLSRPAPEVHQSKSVAITVGVFIYALSSTLILGPNSWNTLFAPSQMWTGVLSLASVILIAWLAAPRLTWNVVTVFFYVIVGIAGLSILYGFSGIMRGDRLAGIVLQPSVLAIVLGAGLIAGLYTKATIRLRWRLIGAALIIIAIMLTQTRAVILALPIILIPFIARMLKLKKDWILLTGVLILVAVLVFTPRLTSLERSVYGATYRYDLAVYSSQYLQIMPPWGFGPGGLLNVSGDFYSMPDSLKFTAEVDQKLPESSHIIILDRFIEYGWLGGISYIVLVVFFLHALYKKRKDDFVKVLGAIGVFVLVQNFVTVPRFHTELIAWVAMLGVIAYIPIKPEVRNG